MNDGLHNSKRMPYFFMRRTSVGALTVVMVTERRYDHAGAEFMSSTDSLDHITINTHKFMYTYIS